MTQFLFNNFQMLDPAHEELRGGYELVVEGEHIREVSAKPIKAPGAHTIDCGGRTLMPGLIDSHVHVVLSEVSIPRLENVPLTLMTARAAVLMRGMLDRGFTSVRDTGGADWGLKEATDKWLLPGPRLFIAGKALGPTGGHSDGRRRTDHGTRCHCCDALHFAMGLADGVAEVRKAVREEMRQGADQVKIMTSGGVASPYDPLDSLQFSPEEVAAAVEEAHAFGRYVCAHAYSVEAITRAAHAGVRGSRDGFHAIGVGADVAAEGVRLLDRGGHFLGGELQAIERVVGGGDPTRRHNFYLIGALAHLLTHGLAHLGNAVRKTHGKVQGIAAMAARAVIGAAAAVAVPTGRSQRFAGDEEPWSRQQPFVGRFFEPPVGATGVAHAGEAAVKHAAHEDGGARRHQRERHVLKAGDRDLRQHDVHVAVDQSRHQCAPAAVDRMRPRRLDRLGRHFADVLTLDNKLIAAAELLVRGVEHLEVLEQELCHEPRSGSEGKASGKRASPSIVS